MLSMDSMVVPCSTQMRAVGISSKAKSVNKNTDLIFKAKHHTNNRKYLNTLAESTKSKYYVFGFLKLLEVRDKKKHCIFCKIS